MDDIHFSNYKNDNSGNPNFNQSKNPKKVLKKTKKRFPLFKAIFLLSFIAIVVFTVGFGYIFNLMRTTNYNESGHKANVYVTSSDLMQNKNVVNILFIGVDRRAEDIASRSDSMILFSIDKNNKKLKLTSFMRDTWVDIPGRSFAKLNAACTWGGAQLVMDTLEYNFNVKIDSYILVDFDTFVDIVNKLGGVTVEISEKEAVYMRDKVHLNINAGERVHLNGNESLCYCRIRYLDSDFMRTFRQRKVMTSIVQRASGTSLFDLLDIVKDILPDVETDLNPLDLTKLSLGAAFSYINYEVEQKRVPADDTWENATKKGQSVLLTDLDANQEMLNDFLYVIDSERELTTE